MKTKFSFLAAFLFISTLISAQDFKVLSSNSTSIVVEYTPVIIDTLSKRSEIGLFTGTGILNGVYSEKTAPGAPLLPSRLFNIGVPSEFGNTLQVLETRFYTLKGKPSPMPKRIFEGDKYSDVREYNESLYSSFVNDDLAVFDEYGIIRDIRVQTVKISPVQYSHQTNELKFFTKIVFRLNYAQIPSNSSVSKEDLLKNVILNYDEARKWGIGKSQLSKSAPSPSVLATGQWVRFEIPEEGIYKIDYSALQNLGFSAGNIDPRTIKIYNNGGYQLPEKINSTRPVDLVENAITVIGEIDGVFNTTDYILFYGRGADFWEPKTFKVWYGTGDSVTVTKAVRVKNYFGKKNYYYITAGGANGKRMAEKSSIAGTPLLTRSVTKSYLFKEDETIKVQETGRLYFGDLFNFSNKSRTYTNTLNELVPGSKINYTLSMANVNHSSDYSTPRTIDFEMSESNNVILRSQLDYLVYTYGFGSITQRSASFTGNLTDNRSTIKLNLTGIDDNAKTAYLNFIEIEYDRYLRAVSDNLLFYSPDTTGLVEFRLSNFSNSFIDVYDITDHKNVKRITGTNISGGECAFALNETKGAMEKYLAVSNTAYKSIPSAKETVENSNYRGEAAGYEYVIIAPALLKNEAEDLKNYRSAQAPSRLSSAVFLTEKIYNEFSCGMVDPSAIRDFLKYAYENWTIKPRFALLLGDGTYDYYGISETGRSKNLIPTMQTVESLDEVDSYPNEDFFARISGNDNKVDIGVGRISVHNTAEAQAVISKIKNYETANETDKNWRSVITLVGDDGFPLKNFDYDLHTVQSEQLALYYIPKTFNINKIYLAAYPTNITSAGRRKPSVNQAILDAMNNGTLILSYIGHGAPNIWADELVLETSSNNYIQNSKFYFLTAATCDFGKFDATSEESGTEKMLIAENAGSIGGLAASRPTYPGPNADLNTYFYNTLLTRHESSGLPVTIGEAYMLTKQRGSYNLFNDERYLLFGDPALRLKVPSLPVAVDSINGVSTSVTSQVRALDRLKIKGSVLNQDLSQNSFNGEALISVFDSEKDVEIPGQDTDPTVYKAKYQGGLIYRGKVTVTNGKYQTELVVPKDISFENKNGKIVTYIYNSQTDGVGFTDNFTVGGTNPSVVNDNKGPMIEVFFDNFTSQGSYLVNSNFTLLVKLRDETGLNTTGVGVGHKLEAIVNDDESNPIDLTNYFVGDLDSGGKAGVITYSFSNYEPGEYKIKLKAWDVFNNASVTETYFTVVESNSLVIKDVVNYPNPFSSSTTFTFQHNLSKVINAKIKIYTVSGRLIKQLENTNIIDKFVRIDWDGRDEDGNSIANGTYLYKLIVETADKEFTQDVLGKLSVIR